MLGGNSHQAHFHRVRTTCGDILARSDSGIKLNKRLIRIFVLDMCFFLSFKWLFFYECTTYVAPCVFCYYYSYVYHGIRHVFDYEDPIPRFRFWSGRKNKYHYSCKIETGFLCGDGARVILLFARVIQQLDFRTQKLQINVDYCYVRRRAEYTSLGPKLEHLSLRSDSSLAAKRCADALHVVFFFNKASEPSTGAAAALCVLSHDT